jgi:predicted RecA/RadA family phage recombinase
MEHNMAKNFVQDGKTISLVNGGTDDILSGEPVAVGKVIAVAITDIAAGQSGDGFTEGVFLLPKLAADAITAGEQVYLKDGKVQLTETDAVVAGVAWESAGANVTVVEVKING